MTNTRNFARSVIACDKREAFAQGSVATKQSIVPHEERMDCFAALAMTNVESKASGLERLS
jgi:hypothetical protein